MQWPFVKIGMHPGGDHRFPGLTLRTLGYYFAVVYGDPDAENNEDESWRHLQNVICPVLFWIFFCEVAEDFNVEFMDI